jgi:hypothetical protein
VQAERAWNLLDAKVPRMLEVADLERSRVFSCAVAVLVRIMAGRETECHNSGATIMKDLDGLSVHQVTKPTARND